MLNAFIDIRIRSNKIDKRIFTHRHFYYEQNWFHKTQTFITTCQKFFNKKIIDDRCEEEKRGNISEGEKQEF